jgi:hypothetical protein
MSNSPEARGLEPCLEHPDYIPPFKGKPIHFEDPQQSTVVKFALLARKKLTISSNPTTVDC